jgi:hypothetical protein
MAVLSRLRRLRKPNSKVSLAPYFSEKAAALENKSTPIFFPQMEAGEKSSLAWLELRTVSPEFPGKDHVARNGDDLTHAWKQKSPSSYLLLWITRADKDGPLAGIFNFLK